MTDHANSNQYVAALNNKQQTKTENDYENIMITINKKVNKIEGTETQSTHPLLTDMKTRNPT